MKQWEEDSADGYTGGCNFGLLCKTKDHREERESFLKNFIKVAKQMDLYPAKYRR
jgi:hypothetical protein